MERKVTRFIINDSSGIWPEFSKRFAKHISRLGVVYFKEQPEIERECEEYCISRGVSYRKKYYLEHYGTGALCEPFYYLSVQDTREYDQKFVELNCDGGGDTICWFGAKQIQKIIVDTRLIEAVNKYGVVVKNYPVSPRVYLITKDLKAKFELHKFTGYSTLPCLNSNQLYSAQELMPDFISERLDNEAKIYQLTIKSKVVTPPNIGNLIAATYCKRCHTAKLIEGELDAEFEVNSLLSVDLQYYNNITTLNGDSIHLQTEIGIISARMLNFCLDNKIKGVKPFSNDPPIKIAAVCLKDLNPDSNQ